MRIKKKSDVVPPRSEKINIPGDVAQLLDEYAAYYLHTYEEKINTEDLINAMLREFIRSDRDFKKYKTAQAMPA